VTVDVELAVRRRKAPAADEAPGRGYVLRLVGVQRRVGQGQYERQLDGERQQQ
jgi:hypothetical protein